MVYFGPAKDAAGYAISSWGCRSSQHGGSIVNEAEFLIDIIMEKDRAGKARAIAARCCPLLSSSLAVALAAQSPEP